MYLHLQYSTVAVTVSDVKLTVRIIPVAVLQQGAHHQYDGGEEDKEEGEEGHYPGPEAEAGVLQQIPPPLLGSAHKSVGENIHIVLHPL